MVSGTLSLQPMGKNVLVLMILLGIMGFFTQGFAKRTWLWRLGHPINWKYTL